MNELSWESYKRDWGALFQQGCLDILVHWLWSLALGLDFDLLRRKLLQDHLSSCVKNHIKRGFWRLHARASFVLQVAGSDLRIEDFGHISKKDCKILACDDKASILVMIKYILLMKFHDLWGTYSQDLNMKILCWFMIFLKAATVSRYSDVLQFRAFYCLEAMRSIIISSILQWYLGFGVRIRGVIAAYNPIRWSLHFIVWWLHSQVPTIFRLAVAYSQVYVGSRFEKHKDFSLICCYIA